MTAWSPLPGGRRRAGLLLPACLAALLLSEPGAPRADVESLTLYQKTARAPLVVRARALSDATRRPRLEVLEIIKGSYPKRTLTIVPHVEDYGQPTPWLKREVFRRGEESILFLAPYVDEFGRDEGSDTFSVMNADLGKLRVPEEGSGALLDALRHFAGIIALGQQDAQSRALRRLLREKNPYLVEAGLAECRKFRMAEPDDLADLLDLLSSPRPEFRAGALALVGQIVSDPVTAPDGPSRTAVFDRIAAVASMDAAEDVRRQAVASLESFGDPPALALIEQIGRSDPSQDVRYAAQVAAVRLKERAGPR